MGTNILERAWIWDLCLLSHKLSDFAFSCPSPIWLWKELHPPETMFPQSNTCVTRGHMHKQCHKITVLFGCQSGEILPKTKEKARVENVENMLDYDFDLHEKCSDFCATVMVVVGILMVTNFKTCAWIVIFAPKIKGVNGKLLAIGCHPPPNTSSHFYRIKFLYLMIKVI